MRLSELKRGQKAVVLGVSGNSEISRRLMEMGFVRGKKVKKIKSAPFTEPVEYELSGFQITLRNNEAALVRVATGNQPEEETDEKDDSLRFAEAIPNDKIREKQSSFVIALVGNPNCGKTSIFNHATGAREHVANYSGVTVASKEGWLKLNGEKVKIVDLPGTYSLSGQSPDERFVADYLINRTPDLIINVLDASNLDRNLYLNTQLKETGIKTMIALNMYDELKSAKASLDIRKFEKYLGMPVVPTIGKEYKGVRRLFIRARQYNKEPVFMSQAAQIIYSPEIEYALQRFTEMTTHFNVAGTFTKRFFALSVLADEPFIYTIPSVKKYKGNVSKIRNLVFREHCEFSESEVSRRIVEKRYRYIESVLSKVYISGDRKKENITDKIDSVLTHETFGLPMFFVFVWLMFFLTFRLGEYPMNWIENGISALGSWVHNSMSEGMLSDLIINGIIGGVGGVLVFLPSIMILFFMISLMEDTGYMSRSAFLMDKVMNKAGLHGKSFIPLLMGFGCNVPAVMATRTIENQRDRILTMMVIPFMSCSARLPVYVLFISAFFPGNQSLILFAIYGIGILAAFSTSYILSKTVFSKTPSPFIMEMPPYRVPGVVSLLKHMWFKSMHFIKKMGTIIFLASVIVWALGYFPRDEHIIKHYDEQIEQVTQQTETPMLADSLAVLKESKGQLEQEKQKKLLSNSYISKFGKAIQPVFAPIGFDWKMSVSILTGVMAKEVVISTMAVLYQSGGHSDKTQETGLVERLRAESAKNQTSKLTYFAFLVFILLYFPCFGTIAAMWREIKNPGWMVFVVLFPLVLAWVLSFLIVTVGGLF
ncbi:MAG: ferrous iron transport protein B [Bacteroidota bacterium]|nr:ferrous iron transport protein B [Bacteroidota bacterium]